MLPIVFVTAGRKIVVVGRGLAAQQRFELVQASGAERIHLFAIDQDGWACHAEAVLHERLPDADDFSDAAVVFIAGLAFDVSADLAALAHAAGAVVNVEDVPELCDFHVPAIMRRGDLIVSVSTGGNAPGLAQKLKARLQTLFGPEWGERVKRAGEARNAWRAQGLAKDQVSKLTAQMIDSENWLPDHAAS